MWSLEHTDDDNGTEMTTHNQPRNQWRQVLIFEVELFSGSNLVSLEAHTPAWTSQAHINSCKSCHVSTSLKNLSVTDKLHTLVIIIQLNLAYIHIWANSLRHTIHLPQYNVMTCSHYNFINTKNKIPAKIQKQCVYSELTFKVTVQ